jgi:hypothetical protein
VRLEDGSVRQVAVRVVPAADLVRRGVHLMAAEAPAFVNVAVVLAHDRDQAPDDRHLTDIGPEPGPEAIRGAGEVVCADEVQKPVHG